MMYQVREIKDSFKPGVIPKFAAICASVAIALCYFIAISMGHQEPIPQTNISATARHYPEYIIFRIVEISAAVFIIAIWVINNWFLREITKIHLIRLPFRFILVIIGTAASLSFMGSTATIDTGKENTSLHCDFARNFFILIIINVLISQFYIEKIRKQAKHVITDFSILLKYICFIILILCGVASLFDSETVTEANLKSDIGNYVEYAGTAGIIIYLYSFGDDWRDFRLEYHRKTKGEMLLQARLIQN